MFWVTKKNNLDLMIYYREKAFDKLNTKDALNDIVDSLPDNKIDDKISLLYESNKVTNISIKTPFGNTERKEVYDVTQQGGLFGSTLWSNSLDKIGKKSLVENKLLYTFKDKIKIPPLFFIDDTAGANKCGLKSLELNTFITTHVELKRLNFNVGTKTKASKCKKLHNGNKPE